MLNRIQNIVKDAVLRDEKGYLLYLNHRLKEFKNSNPSDYLRLQQNKKFQNSYCGKRCFILGNGPSLEGVDFSLLSNEYVFSVNLITGMSEYEKLNTNFHFLMDYAAFGIRSNLKMNPNLFAKEIKKVGVSSNAEIFLPFQAKEFVKKYGLDKCCKINYLYIEGSFVENYQRSDLTKQIPSFTTVVQYAILVAIYMGFKEIYLLGCDATIIKSVLDIASNGSFDKSIHAYEDKKYTDKQQDSFKQILNTMKLDMILYDSYILFKGYRKLGTYCKKKGITLINLTENSLIDTIPKKNLRDIL